MLSRHVYFRMYSWNFSFLITHLKKLKLIFNLNGFFNKYVTPLPVFSRYLYIAPFLINHTDNLQSTHIKSTISSIFNMTIPISKHFSKSRLKCLILEIKCKKISIEYVILVNSDNYIIISYITKKIVPELHPLL